MLLIICYESPFKIEFHKKPATVARYRLSCSVPFRAEAAYLIVIYKTVNENLVYVYVVYV